MANATSDHTVTFDGTQGAGIVNGSTTFNLSGYDPYDGAFDTAFTGSIPYASISSGFNAKVPNYYTQLRISINFNSFNCSSTDTVSLTPSLWKYDIMTGNSNSTTACNASTVGQSEVYSTVNYGPSTLEQSSPTFFTNASLTSAFNGSSIYYALKPNGSGPNTVAVIINSLGVGGSVFNCG